MDDKAKAGPVPRRRLAALGERFAARARRSVVRRLSSSLTRRIAFLNLAGLLALFVGFLWLNQTRVGVIDARSQSLSLQAEIIAAAVAGTVIVEPEASLLEPERLLQQLLGETQREEPSALSLEFSINPARAAPILKRLVTPTRTRARIFDQDGVLLLDTRAFANPGGFGPVEANRRNDDSATLFARSWNAVKQRFGRVDLGPSDEVAGPRQFPEVPRALRGQASNVVRVSTDGQTILFAAAPVQRANRVRGVLLLSTEEGDIDRVIADERWGYVLVFLVASGVMLVLSVLMAGAIADPVRRLAEAADRVRRGIRARHEIPDFSYRTDEIGDLSGSLREMTAALYNRIEGIERFAADVAHELKNPLTSLRSAVETLPLARNEDSRSRLLQVILHDVQRLDRLITDISDASRLDAELQRHETAPVDLARLLDTVAGMHRDVARPGDPPVLLRVLPPDPDPRLFALMGHDSRLVQVFDNLIENAKSFSPPGGSIRIEAERKGIWIEVRVDDDGPGIPDHALQRIFERFYTDRPDPSFGQNSGLGLSISRQIVEAHGGTIVAENRLGPEGAVAGARFRLRFPALAPASGGTGSHRTSG